MITKYRLIIIAGLVLLLTLSFASTSAQTDEPGGDMLINGFVVSYGGYTYDEAADTTTFTFTVTGTGTPPALSHFDLEIPTCDIPLEVVGFSPTDAVELGTDPTTGVSGIKWDLPLEVDASRTYTLTFAGEIEEGEVLAAVKGGNGFIALFMPGPACELPDLQVEKLVSTDGETWEAVESPPGPEIEEIGSDVYFKFVVTNNGDAPLTDLALADNSVDASGCALPDTLEPDESAECDVGPVPAEEGLHLNTVTATATLEGETLSATDSASYFGGDLEEALPVVIVIEGPVSGIRGNIIIIYGMEFELDPDDPLLAVIHLGDILAISGTALDWDGSFVIVIIAINFISVEVYVSDEGEVWRDSDNCQNAPPPWAPAHGWRRRCEEGGGEGSGS